MTAPFTLQDFDQPFFEEDEESDDIRVYLEARYADGTSEVFELVYPDPWDIRSIIYDFDGTDTHKRVNQLSPIDMETYDRWFDDSDGCSCGGVCGESPCTIDDHERRDWLKWRTRGGAIVTWWWQPFGFSGSQEIGGHDIGYDESGDQLHNRIDISSFLHDIGLPVRWT
jgi:hypothetical protein